MTENTPRRMSISSLLVSILIIYVIFNAIILMILASELPDGIFHTLMDIFSQFGWNFTREFTLLIIPSTILILIFTNKLDLKTRFILGRILSFISFIVVLLNLAMLSLHISLYYSGLGLIDLSSASAIFFFIFLIQSVLFLIITLLMTVKIEIDGKN